VVVANAGALLPILRAGAADHGRWLADLAGVLGHMGSEEEMKIVLALAMLSISTAAQAQAYSCTDLRSIVQKYGERKAIQVARKSGVSEEMIRMAISICIRK
jgi:hypothetical protein